MSPRVFFFFLYSPCLGSDAFLCLGGDTKNKVRKGCTMFIGCTGLLVFPIWFLLRRNTDFHFSFCDSPWPLLYFQFMFGLCFRFKVLAFQNIHHMIFISWLLSIFLVSLSIYLSIYHLFFPQVTAQFSLLVFSSGNSI